MFKPFQTRIALLAAILTLFLFSLAAALGFACRPGTPDGSRLDGGALDVDAGRTPRLNEAYTILPGPPGPAGPAGSAGDAGFSAFTTTTATFTQPAVLSNVTVSLVDTAAYAANEVLYVAGGGYYEVNAIGSGTITLTNLGYTGNASPTSTVTSPALVTPGGLEGATGPAGDAGSPGSAGTAAFTSTTAGFTMPAVNATVSVAVGNTSWMAAAMPVWVQSAGFFQIASITDGTHVVLTNNYFQANAAQGASIGSNNLVASSGFLSSRETVPDSNTQHAFSFADGDAGTPWQDTGSVGGWGPLVVKAGNPLADGGVTIVSGLFGTAPDNGIYNTSWANTPMLYGAEGSGSELTPPFTISCWFLQRYNGGGNPEVIMGRSNEGSLAAGTQFSVGLAIQGGSGLEALMVIGGSPLILAGANQSLSTNVWHHVGMTWDGTTWQLYQDGNLTASAAQSGSITYIAANGWSFLGAYGHGWSGEFENSYGSIQNAWFDNVVRPASWFMNIWQRGAGQF